MDEGVVGASTFGEPAGRIVRLGVFAGCRRYGRLPRGVGIRGGRRQVTLAGAVAGDRLLDRRGEVLPEMETIGTLEGLRRGGVGRLRIGTGAVSADDLDSEWAASHGPRVAASRSSSRSRT